MSKLTKFFKHPVMFFEDAQKNKKIKEGKPKIFVVGFSTWKTYLRMYFSEYDLIFLPKDIKKSQFNSQYRKQIVSLKDSCQVFIWGFKAPEYILEFLREEKISTKFVEDGFVRSVQLGATKAPPMSLCLDSKTPYFDATRPSELEDLLGSYVLDEKENDAAKKNLQSFLGSRVSKYNHNPHCSPIKIYGKKNKKRVLVIGQVEDDASIIYGCNEKINNNDLVRLAHAENPNAEIFYKPHPDVLAGYRDYFSKPEDVSHLCKIVSDNVSLPSCLSSIDHVYTITSLSGLEALLRGIKVTTIGAPFYSGWGLTDDRQKVERRVRKLRVHELFHIAYIVYPKYFKPESGDGADLDYVVAQVAQKKTSKIKKVVPQKNGVKAFASEKSGLSDYASKMMKDIFSSVTGGGVLKFGDYRLKNSQLIVVKESSVFDFSFNAEAFPTTGDPLCNKGVIPFEYKGENLEAKNIEHFLNVAFYKKNNDFLSLFHHYENSNRGSLRSTVVYGLKAGVYDDYVLNSAVDYISFGFNEVSEQDKLLILKKLYRVYGVKGPVEHVLGLYLKNKERLTLDLLVTCVGMLCEAGDYSKALKLAVELHEKNSTLWFTKRILVVSWLLYNAGVISEEWARVDAENYDALQFGTGVFEEYAKIGNIAVVGNSPCDVGLEKGKLIDSYDKVVRFNSANTYHPHNKDYGAKTNVLVINPRYYETERNTKLNIEFVVLSDANIFLTPCLSYKIDELKKYANHVCIIPQKVDFELVKKVGGSPSSGLKMLYWLYYLNGQISSKNVFGFSMVDQDYGVATPYSSDAPKKLNTIHNWSKEFDLFSKIVTEEKL